MEVDPTRPIFKADTSHAKWMSRSPFFGGALLICTVVVAVMIITFCRDIAQFVLFAMAACWAVGAPVWFLAEYHWIYRSNPGDGSWDLFKHGQQLAIAVWASVATSLYALGSSDLGKPKESLYQCSVEDKKEQSTDNLVPTSLLLRCRLKARG